MMKLAVMMALGMLVAGGAYAQNTPQKVKKERVEVRTNRKAGMQKGTEEERAARQTEMMSRKLGLSEAQKSELHALNMRRVQELQALNDKYDKTDARNEAQRAERKAIQERWQADMRKVLDEKQYAKYEADRKARPERIEKKTRKVRTQKKVKEARQKQNG